MSIPPWAWALRDSTITGSRKRRKAAKAGKSAKAKASGRRSLIGRTVYWGAVASLWAVIAMIGGIVWVGMHLPPIQSLEIPKRPPSFQIVDLNGRTLATRGDMGGAAVALAFALDLERRRATRPKPVARDDAPSAGA